MNSISDPNCMNCHVAWNRDFIDNALSKTFRRSEYKKHRESILLDREKSLLPATIPLVEQEKQRRQAEKLVNELIARKNELMRQVQEVSNLIFEARNAHHRVQDVADGGGPSNGSEKRTFIRACVMPNCRGFLSTQWKCEICNTWVCPDCHEPKRCQRDDNHKCDPNNLETAKLLAKDTKPCPKCASMIHRTEGCRQMWCIICHTTFDWATGKELQTTNIHNPEYYRYLREKNGGVVPRNPGDIPLACGGLPTYWILHDFVKKHENWDKRLKKLSHIHRTLGHITDYDLRRHVYDPITSNQDLRVRYLLNEISDDDWKKELQKREKKRELTQARNQVYEMLVMVASDLLNKLIRTKQQDVATEIMNEFENLIEYYNSSMLNVAERFSSKSLKVFNADWIMI